MSKAKRTPKIARLRFALARIRCSPKRLVFLQKILFSTPIFLLLPPVLMSTIITRLILLKQLVKLSVPCHTPKCLAVCLMFHFHFEAIIRYAKRFTQYFYTTRLMRVWTWGLLTPVNSQSTLTCQKSFVRK